MVIHGRNEEKLKGVCKELEVLATKFKVQVEYVVSDADDVSEKNLQRVVERFKERSLKVLVNNVGIGQGGKVKVGELEDGDVEKCLRVNCLYPTLLTKTLIPTMLKGSGRNVIVNLASVAALITCPLSSVYGATKAFNRSFSNSIGAEYAEQGVDVLTVNPGYVATNMTQMSESLLCCGADECAERSLAAFEFGDIMPHWKHALMYTVVAVFDTILPWFIKPSIFYKVIETALKIKAA